MLILPILLTVMNRSPFTAFKNFACRAGIVLAICGLSIAGALAKSGATIGIDLSDGEVYPVTGPELDFGDTPQPLLLAQGLTDLNSARAWESAVPSTERYDWVQTTSGEWLKGELKALYLDKLEFDSKEFDLQTIDWEDVAQLLGHGTKRVRINLPAGLKTFDGVVFVNQEKVFITSSAGVQEFDRDLVISITPDAASERDNWSGKISLGLNIFRGNTDQSDSIAKLNIKRRTPENRFIVDYIGKFSKVRDVQTVNNHRLSSIFDIYAARNYFWRPFFGEYYRDPFQNIYARTTIGVAAGYHLVDKPKTTWDVSGGPAVRSTRFVSVEPGVSDNADTPTLVGTTYYDTELTRKIDFNVRYNFSILDKASGTYTHFAIATFEIELTEHFDFDIAIAWDRTRDPQVRSDGSVPDQDDFQLLMTLGFEI